MSPRDAERPPRPLRVAFINEVQAAVDSLLRDREQRRAAPARQKRIDRDKASAVHHITGLRAVARFDPDDREEALTLLDRLTELVEFYARWDTLPRVAHRPSDRRFWGAVRQAMMRHHVDVTDAAKVIRRVTPRAHRTEVIGPWLDERTIGDI